MSDAPDLGSLEVALPKLLEQLKKAELNSREQEEALLLLLYYTAKGLLID
jgi:hypothetical protein